MCGATTIRGPTTSPAATALRRSMVGKSISPQPKSRTVVNPFISRARSTGSDFNVFAMLESRAISSPTGGASVTWVWQSMKPGVSVCPDRSTTRVSGGASIVSATRWIRSSTTSTWRGVDCAEIPSQTVAPVISVAGIVVTFRSSEAIAQDPRRAGAGFGHAHHSGRESGRRRIQVDLRRVRQAGFFDQPQARTPALRDVGIAETLVGPLGSDGTEDNLHSGDVEPANVPIVVHGQFAGLEVLGNVVEQVHDHRLW